jgi:hypothetical protein
MNLIRLIGTLKKIQSQIEFKELSNFRSFNLKFYSKQHQQESIIKTAK